MAGGSARVAHKCRPRPYIILNNPCLLVSLHSCMCDDMYVCHVHGMSGMYISWLCVMYPGMSHVHVHVSTRV